MPAITNGFRLLQSSYAKGINKQESRSGNLFQQKTKAKLVSSDNNYAFTAFVYIHQNPVEAKLATNAEDWAYSSWKDYTGIRNGTLCNLQRGKDLLGLTALDLRLEVIKKMGEDDIKKIF